MKQSKNKKVNQFGFSDMRLWPVQLLMYHLIIIFGSMLGSYWLSVALIVPVFIYGLVQVHSYDFLDTEEEWPVLDQETKRAIDEAANPLH